MKLDAARKNLEYFHNDPYGALAITALEDGLSELNEISANPNITENCLYVINNLINRLFQMLISEAKRLRDIKPLARLADVEYWLKVMHIPRELGFESPKEYKDAGQRLRELLGVIKSTEGRITKESREYLLDNPPSDF